MARRRLPRKNSTQKEQIFSNIVMMMRTQKQKVLTLAATPIHRRLSSYFWGILVIRLLGPFLIYTEFVPDEGWQSTEVAYYYTWGAGRPLWGEFNGTTQGNSDFGHLTWEWRVGLRNHLIPGMLTGMFHVLKWLGWDTPGTLIMFPRLAQAAFTAIGDYCLFLYTTARFGRGAGKWALGLALGNWFLFYTSSRTITNTTEMTLNSIALYLLGREKIVAMVGVVAVNFLIRPTAIVIWIPQVLDLWPLFFPPKVAHRLPGAIFVGLSILIGGALMDSWVLGKPVISWIRFLKFNVLEGGSSQFGSHHVLWYFYSALPSIFGIALLPLALSLTLHVHQKDWIRILGFISVFSLLPHKEIRFLLPILPSMFALMGDVAQKCWEVGGDKDLCKRENVNIRSLVTNFAVLYGVINAFAALYFCGFHQGGIGQATEFVNIQAVKVKNPRIWVMMQCYTFPVYTYLHNPNATFEMLSCAPPNLEGMGLDYATLPNYDVYKNFTTAHTLTNMSDPVQLATEIAAHRNMSTWVRSKLLNNLHFPDYIICFKTLSERIVRVMFELGKRYERCFFYPHAQFGEDKGTAVVLCPVWEPLLQLAELVEAQTS